VVGPVQTAHTVHAASSRVQQQLLLVRRQLVGSVVCDPVLSFSVLCTVVQPTVWLLRGGTVALPVPALRFDCRPLLLLLLLLLPQWVCCLASGPAGC
jgi:hypothetical protein